MIAERYTCRVFVQKYVHVFLPVWSYANLILVYRNELLSFFSHDYCVFILRDVVLLFRRRNSVRVAEYKKENFTLDLIHFSVRFFTFLRFPSLRWQLCSWPEKRPCANRDQPRFSARQRSGTIPRCLDTQSRKRTFGILSRRVSFVNRISRRDPPSSNWRFLRRFFFLLDNTHIHTHVTLRKIRFDRVTHTLLLVQPHTSSYDRQLFEDRFFNEAEERRSKGLW